MSGRRHRRTLPLLLAAVLLACSGDELGPVGLESIGDRDGEASDDREAPATDDGAPAAPSGSEAPDTPEPARGTVDGQLATGPFEVGIAGVVTFDLVDGELRLEGVEPAPGWRERSRTVDGDEIELELVRDDGGEASLEIELEDGDELSLEFDLAVDGVEPGTFRLGDAGAITVAVRDGGLVVDDLSVVEGWQLSEDDRGEREAKVELERGDERWKTKLRLRGGTLRYEVEYRTGDVTRGRGR